MKLPDLQITRDQSADWKALADAKTLPEEKFLQIFDALKAKGDVPPSSI